MIENMNCCTIGLGSNTSDRQYQIEKAIENLLGHLEKASASSVYESEAFNGKDEPYLNAVVHGYTALDRETFVKELKEWEAQNGRTIEDTLKGLIKIDLDLVIWNEHILRPKDFERHYFNRGYRELLANGAYEAF
ncbi:MAG: 2-amino-4-hydroxy-6-hydroxymethyldihydropteridine diphosphokinase [Duncaniella sp.]|nr:2-amino-4-hydroxy-6-hydroxymethyldihydropteridine diphosphokinase [Duncaniella sp.]